MTFNAAADEMSVPERVELHTAVLTFENIGAGMVRVFTIEGADDLSREERAEVAGVIGRDRLTVISRQDAGHLAELARHVGRLTPEVQDAVRPLTPRHRTRVAWPAYLRPAWMREEQPITLVADDDTHAFIDALRDGLEVTSRIGETAVGQTLLHAQPTREGRVTLEWILEDAEHVTVAEAIARFADGPADRIPVTATTGRAGLSEAGEGAAEDGTFTVEDAVTFITRALAADPATLEF